MSLEVTGKLHHVYPTQQIKETFSKREFVLEITDESPSGMVYTNYAAFQLVNNSCAVIDQFQPGEMLKVSFNIRGNRWERDGNVKYITNLNAWRVERAADAHANPAPGSYSTSMTQATPQGPAMQQSGTPDGHTADDADDLPF
ncbi:MAG TPA: DUF3127 domain-containing protein [Edaphocola sp.]|nr:DUF3127 domain-containing protein [Edaphocola sp.]